MSNSTPISKNVTPTLHSFGEIFCQGINALTVNDILMAVTHDNRIKSCLRHCTSSHVLSRQRQLNDHSAHYKLAGLMRSTCSGTHPCSTMEMSVGLSWLDREIV